MPEDGELSECMRNTPSLEVDASKRQSESLEHDPLAPRGECDFWEMDPERWRSGSESIN